MLQNAAGPRIEPPVSEPSAPWTSPAARAAPDPLEDPPGTCARFHGFFAGWKRWPGNWMPKANSWVVSLPSITPPAFWSRATHVASSSGTQSARRAGPAGGGGPRGGEMFLLGGGMPRGGRAPPPRARAAPAPPAPPRARLAGDGAEAWR